VFRTHLESSYALLAIFLLHAEGAILTKDRPIRSWSNLLFWFL